MPAISDATIHGKLSAPETLRGRLSGSTVTVGPLSVTENGVYAAPRGTAYSPVTVDVPTPAPSLQSKTATPTEQQQTVAPDSGYDGLSSVTVDAIPPTYVGSGVAQRTSADLTASGATVTVPAGHYAQQASKAVASGTEGTPTATKGSVSNHAVTVTPSVTNSAGYIAGGTHSGTGVTVAASELVSGSTTITENGTVDVTEYASVTVDVPTGGGGSEPDSGDRTDPIRFFDYDGRLVASYTSVPSAMPDVPTHDRLTNGTWNYTLAQVAEQFDAVGKCDVGANYDTASGKTEIDVTLDSAHLDPYLCVAVNGTVTVDWGDGSDTDTITGTSWTVLKPTQHVYAQAGEYTISIDGAVGFYGSVDRSSVLRLTNDTSTNRLYSGAYSNCVTAIRVADGSRIGDYAFQNCYSLASITIPDGVSIDTSAFQNCYSLASITIPSGVTRIGSYAFQNCYSLTSVSIPYGVSIDTSAFQNCYSLTSVSIPGGVASIGTSAVQNCYGLTSVTIPSGVTSIGSSIFNSCHRLASVTIPDGVTSISGSLFSNCYGLTSVTIPSGVTSIGSSAFFNCRVLTSVSIPDGVTSIGSKAFQNCYGVLEYHLEPTTPPNLSSTNAFSGIVAGTVIYVPKGCLEAYQTASNWSSYKSYMQEEA